MILPYQLETTNDLLTSRAGLLAVAQIMDSLRLEERKMAATLDQASRGRFVPGIGSTWFAREHEAFG